MSALSYEEYMMEGLSHFWIYLFRRLYIAVRNRRAYAIHPHVADIATRGNDAGAVELFRVQIVLDFLRDISA